MTLEFLSVLVDTHDYTALEWFDLGDDIKRGVDDDLRKAIEDGKVVTVMRSIGLLKSNESDAAKGGYKTVDYDYVESLLDDINGAIGVVVVEDERRQEILQMMMEKANL